MAEAPDAGMTPSTPAADNRRVGLLVTLAALILIIGVAAFLGYGYFTGRQRAASGLAEAETILEEADQAVGRIDQAVGAPVAGGVETRADQAQALVGKTSSELARTSQIIDRIQGDLRGTGLERATLLKKASEARLQMLASAPGILSSSAKAGRALAHAESAWKRTVEADSVSDREVAAYNKLTPSGVKEATRLNKLAATELAAAREQFAAAESAFPEAGLEQYIAYVDARIALNKLSRRSNGAWIADDVAEANALIGEYNKADEAATAQAKALPASPAKVVADAYTRVTKAASDRYHAAREKATAADQLLKGL